MVTKKKIMMLLKYKILISFLFCLTIFSCNNNKKYFTNHEPDTYWLINKKSWSVEKCGNNKQKTLYLFDNHDSLYIYKYDYCKDHYHFLSPARTWKILSDSILLINNIEYQYHFIDNSFCVITIKEYQNTNTSFEYDTLKLIKTKVNVEDTVRVEILKSM
jgi:hypothetical protein